MHQIISYVCFYFLFVVLICFCPTLGSVQVCVGPVWTIHPLHGYSVTAGEKRERNVLQLATSVVDGRRWHSGDHRGRVAGRNKRQYIAVAVATELCRCVHAYGVRRTSRIGASGPEYTRNAHASLTHAYPPAGFQGADGVDALLNIRRVIVSTICHFVFGCSTVHSVLRSRNCLYFICIPNCRYCKAIQMPVPTEVKRTTTRTRRSVVSAIGR